MDVFGIGVLLDRGIDEKHHRHIDFLARLERLLGEAEALDLLEIFADRIGRTLYTAWPTIARALRFWAR